MSLQERNEQLDSHAVHGLLDILLERARAIEPPDGHEQARRRVVDALLYAQRRIAGADHAVVPPMMFDQVYTAASQLSGSWDNLETTGDFGLLEQLATADVVTLLHAVAPIPVHADAVVQAAELQVKRLSDLALDGEANRLALNETVAAEVEGARQALAASRSEFEAEASAIRSQLSDLATTISQEEARLTTTLGDFETRGSAARTEFDTKASTALAAAETKSNTAVDEFKAAAAATLAQQVEDIGERADEWFAEAARNRTASEDAAAALLDELEKSRDKAVDLVGVVANTGTAAHFQKVADYERNTANTWRIVAVVLAGAAVVVAFVTAFSASQTPDLDWQHLLAKALITLTIAGVAAYAGRQSAEHREQERQARHTELQLKAIGAFLETMDEAQRAEIQNALAAHVFGPRAENPGKAEAADAPFGSILAQLASAGYELTKNK